MTKSTAKTGARKARADKLWRMRLISCALCARRTRTRTAARRPQRRVTRRFRHNWILAALRNSSPCVLRHHAHGQAHRITLTENIARCWSVEASRPVLSQAAVFTLLRIRASAASGFKPFQGDHNTQ